MSAPTGSPARLSVVLPVYRNRPQLPELLARLRSTLDRSAPDWEVVFVEDAGGDGSREWIAEQARSDARLRLVANDDNLGQHASIVRGLGASRGELVAVMDADLQDAPEDLSRLLAAWRPELGAVFAQRRARYQPAARHWSGLLFKRLVGRLLGARLPRRVGTFVLLGAEARRRILAAPTARPYLPLLLVATGLPLATVEIDKHERSDGRSAYTGRRRAVLGLRIVFETLRWRIRGG